MSGNNQLRDVFDAIADPTRRRLISSISRDGGEVQVWLAFYNKFWS
nr:helix-turn-helix domain-containing protein [Cohnella cholangitidis]